MELSEVKSWQGGRIGVCPSLVRSLACPLLALPGALPWYQRAPRGCLPRRVGVVAVHQACLGHTHALRLDLLSGLVVTGHPAACTERTWHDPLHAPGPRHGL